MNSIKLAERFHITQLILKSHKLPFRQIDLENRLLIINDWLAINDQLFLHYIDSTKRDYNFELMYACATNEARQFVDAYLAAHPLVGMEDERFVELLRWNKVVWAARVTSYNTLEFVTWKDYQEENNYAHGHYFDSSYRASKKDFAIRAGLSNSDYLEDL